MARKAPPPKKALQRPAPKAKLPASPRTTKPAPKALKPAPASAPKRPAPAPAAPAKRQPTKTAPQRPAPTRKPPVPPPVAKPAPKAPKPAPAKAPVVDPFDTTPSPPADAPCIPGAYKGWLWQRADDGSRVRDGSHVCIVYKRTLDNVFAILMAQPIRIQEFSPAVFDADMRPLTYENKAYPVDRAVKIFLASFNGHTDKALRVLKRLAAGRSVDEEDTLEDLLDITPSPIRKGGKVSRQAAPSDERASKRRSKRQARLAAMTPIDREAWQAKRKARRAARRAAKGK